MISAYIIAAGTTELAAGAVDGGDGLAPIHVPATLSGQGGPPVIAFAPGYLAEALAIGPTLRLIDGISPGMASDTASGSFCVLMPCRCVAGVATAEAGNARAA